MAYLLKTNISNTQKSGTEKKKLSVFSGEKFKVVALELRHTINK